MCPWSGHVRLGLIGIRTFVASFGQGKSDLEDRAALITREKLNLASMDPFHDTSGEGQTDTPPSRLGRHAWLEELFSDLGGHSRTGVLNL